MSETQVIHYQNLLTQVHKSLGQLRWGYIGTGNIAKSVARDFALAGIQISAVGSRNIETAESFASEFSIPHSHGSYEALVNDPEVDVVYINTLNHVHCENTLLALNAGKHVLLEKPFTLNAKEAEKLAELARSKNLFLMEAMWTRFLPGHRVIQEIIQKGTIGTPYLFIADHSQYLPEKTHNRLWDLNIGGGALLDLGIYCVSYSNWILGNHPTRVSSSAIMSHTKVDLSDVISLEYSTDNGVTAHASLTTSMAAAGPNTAAIVGSNGRIEIDSRFYNQTSFRVFDIAGNLIGSYDEKVEGFGRQYQALEVEQAITAGKPESEIMSLDATIANMKVLDQIRDNCSLKYPQEE